MTSPTGSIETTGRRSRRGPSPVPLDAEPEVLGRDDDVRQLAVLGGEVLGRTVHAVHLPVDAVEVEVAHAAVGERLVHLELDALLDQPLAHLALGPARAPHAVGGDRAVAVAGAGVVRGAHAAERGVHLLGAPLGVVGPQPLDPIVHGRDAGPRHLRVGRVNPRMCAAFSSGVRDACHAFIRRAARRSCSLRSGRCASAVIVLRRASRWASEIFGIVISSVSPTHDSPISAVAGGGEQPVLQRRLDLAAALGAHAVDRLSAGLDDPLDLVRPDLAVGPHRHQLARLEAVRL